MCRFSQPEGKCSWNKCSIDVKIKITDVNMFHHVGSTQNKLMIMEQ